MRRLALFLILTLVSTAIEAAAHHAFWTIRGAHNTVYLLGSVHLLKPEESQLPEQAEEAYAKSKTIVLEVNLNELNSASVIVSSLKYATLPAGQTLEEVLGADLYADFLNHANALGIDAIVFKVAQPWFAALMLDEAQMAKLGFAASAGVDEQMAARAQSDHKQLIGLETMDDQLSIFSQLSMDEQRRYMRYSLSSLNSAADDIKATITAWKAGDTRGLERLLDEDFKEFPDLRRRLTTDRNRRWIEKIVPMLNADDDYLVVVGALHMVGSDGLVALLQKRGYPVVQH